MCSCKQRDRRGLYAHNPGMENEANAAPEVPAAAAPAAEDAAMADAGEVAE